VTARCAFGAQTAGHLYSSLAQKHFNL